MGVTVMKLLGHPALTRTVITATAQRLRVLAFHDIIDPAGFRAQLAHLIDRYHIVTGQQVAHASLGGPRLPARAVWITFDDGHPAVFRVGAPILAEFGITATAYVCPGLVETQQPFWWETVRKAARHGLTVPVDSETIPAPKLEAALKRSPDPVRRQVVRELGEKLSTVAPGHVNSQATLDDLRSWIRRGHEIGNHTWDHPCLDRCSDDEQRRQVTRAHEWLESHLDIPVSSFAYPNGNWGAAAEDQLRRLGYRTGVGFDHHLHRPSRDPLRISRLRLDSDAPAARARAVVSGTHPALLSARTVLRSDTNDDPRRLPR